MAEEEKIEQHIIADRTLIRTARIISGILTPFSIPLWLFWYCSCSLTYASCRCSTSSSYWELSTASPS